MDLSKIVLTCKELETGLMDLEHGINEGTATGEHVKKLKRLSMNIYQKLASIERQL